MERTQEFVLEWAPPGGPRERSFASSGTLARMARHSEIEDYHVDLNGVSVLQLTINPDIAHDRAPASLSQWRVA